MPVPVIDRRTFLQTAAAALAAPLIAPRVGHPASTATNSRLQHACIGVGGMGFNDLKNFLSHEGTQVVTLCDVDADFLAAARVEAPDARVYTDWRELFEKEAGRVDSVNVSVPDHMHAAIAMTAMKFGIHVYCQKPMCHDLAEVRALTMTAASSGLVTQLGTQHASGIGDRMGVQFIRDGVIGKIKHVYLCSNRPGAVEKYRLVGPRPDAGRQQKPPAPLDWDRWIGTAPMRPFVPEVYHPRTWRSWQDFGTGWSGDIGCHIFDAAWRALDLEAPRSVVAKVQESWENSPARRAETWPQGDHITWVFPGSDRTAGNELTVEWFDGEFYPPKEIMEIYHGETYPAESAMFIGTEGSLLLPHTSGPLLYPMGKFREMPRPKLSGRNHYHHFADACLGHAQNESHFQQTGPMTEAVLLGTIAIRNPDTLLEWDAAAMSFPENAAANAMLKRDYREGWTVEGLG